MKKLFIYFSGLDPNLFWPFDPSFVQKYNPTKVIKGTAKSKYHHPDLFVSWSLLTPTAAAGIRLMKNKTVKINPKATTPSEYIRFSFESVFNSISPAT